MSRRTQPICPQWQHLQWCAGIDWGRQTHHVVLVDPDGRIWLDMPFDHDADGWDRLRRAFRQLAGEDLSVVGVAIETRSGPAVEKLLELGCTVFPMHPKAAQRYRDRKAPSGVKDDGLDAWSFGDALRTDGRHWRALEPEDPLTQELRLLCRDEVRLIAHRTALINELQQALHEYYPAALEAFSDWTSPAVWAFVERFPTPQKLRKAARRRWEKFLHTHRLYRPQTYEHRMEVFSRATELCASEPVTEAKSRLAVSLARQLRNLQTQIDQYRKRINQLFDQHPQ